MSIDINQKSEIDQLRLIAKMYYELAEKLKSHLDVAMLTMTIREFSDCCKDMSYLYHNTELLHASAHLSSSAIRLYSIEEILRSLSKRWQEYDRIRNLTDKHQVKHAVKSQMNSLIHFLLRHMVSHSESEWKRFKKYKIAYETMRDIYFELDYRAIFVAYRSAIEAVEKEFGAPYPAVSQGFGG